MKHENTRALYRYWNDLRAGRNAPYRSELDPRAIATLLESTFILEHGGVSTPRFRLAGTRLCDQFGMELRGMSALALWHGDCRSRMKNLLEQVVTEPCIGHVACTVETRGGYLFDAEFLYLPLRSDLGEMTRILGCGYYMGGGELGLPGQEPIHHWIENVNVYQIDSVEPVSADAPTRALPPLVGGEDVPIRMGSTTPIAPHAARLKAVRPMLRAIDGGMTDRGAVAAALSKNDDTVRERSHLRLVKSDVN